jgi:RHS repeat-associated protein
MNGGFRVRPDGQFVANSLNSRTAQKGGQEAGKTNESGTAQQTNQSGSASPLPSISLPKGGGAIRGMGEKFAANPVTGTGSLSVPIFTSPGRSGFGPQLSLSYDSGSGNGPFGFGWSLSLPSITRKTDKGLPKYQDTEESDVFILSGAEDLVPVLMETPNTSRTINGKTYGIDLYRPRIEGLFARIERWTSEQGDVHWRSISKDNILTVYGRDDESRIFDPEDHSRIFSWLICESYDDKGNAIVYEYQTENEKGIDLSQANESNRLCTANRYLKRIKYGNRHPLLLDKSKTSFRKSHIEQIDFSSADWMFQVVFDYDEDYYEELPYNDTPSEAEQHKFIRASSSAGRTWPCRPDPFSTYRAGFEVRTYRRCHRVLMFHSFPELGNEPYLVRSTEFDYSDLDYSHPLDVETELNHKGSTRFASFIQKVTQSGYVQYEKIPLTYLKKSLPPLEFDYSKATIQEKIEEIDSKSLENLPYGLDGAGYHWVDLDGEGLSGIITEQAGAWFYKPNMGDGKFGAMETVATKPSLASLNGGSTQLLDLAGDGQLDVAEFGTVSGFYERTVDQKWENFIPFTSLPNIPWKDPNLKFVDLTGDGHADVMITEDEVFTWYPSLAEEGFGPSEMVRQALDEEKGPRLVFDDGTQSIYLADFSGDGLTDLVRIRNGEVCYWPNLGYGRFGAKVTMDNAPWFDYPDMFDQKRIRLADVDGSGVTDIIYLGYDGASIYFNHSGNSWSSVRKLVSLPHIDNISSVYVADLFGNGTACLVWSSPLPGDSSRPMLYIDLMGGQKPHLMVNSKNNMGAETVVQYASSTTFYLKDKAEGKPWITRIPFPVHVVESVETHDHISQNRFVTSYAYHHGYFDGIEREFRGFGMVEQWDTEEFAVLSNSDAFSSATNIDEASHVPPVLTKTWFHTGAYLRGEEISRQLAHEYFGAPDPDNPEFETFLKTLLDDTVLPSIAMKADETCEACRALKGSILRQEVYAQDGSPKAGIPYSVSERNYNIELLQPRGSNQHAVFFTHANETINYHYERNIQDPRIQHELVLEVDDYGNVLKSAAVGYGRLALDLPDQQKQTTTLITCTQNDVTKSVDDEDAYRTPVVWQARTYELTGYDPAPGADRFTYSDFGKWENNNFILKLDKEINYEVNPSNGKQIRLIEHVRTLYRSNKLKSLLPVGEIESLALPGESYKLAFTPDLLTKVFDTRTDDNMFTEGGYVHSKGDVNWWIPSGRVFFDINADDKNPAATAAAELTEACSNFFLPRKFTDPFGSSTTIDYDKRNLLMVNTQDAAGNSVHAENDYRVLQPYLVTDPNDNRSQVIFDALGMVAGAAVMGKENEPDAKSKGDLLAGFQPDLTQTQLDAFMAEPRVPGADPSEGAAAQIMHDLLGKATSRIIYDIDRFWRTGEPPFAATIARETHTFDLEVGKLSKLQVSFSYSDGFGREIQKKIQAEPGPIEGVYLFSWEEIQGNDSEILTDFLKSKYDVDWVKTAKITKTNTSKTIMITAGENFLSLNLINENTEMNLEIDNGKTDKFIVKTENGKLNIYEGVIGDVNPRWVGSGWTIFNNKGKPVRQYEPFFDNTHEFKFGKKVGVSPILFYDPVERVIATLHPNNTYEKVVFDPWHQKTYDVNDTVAMDPRTDPDISGYVAEYFKQEAPLPENWKTWLQQREVDPDAPPQESPGMDPEKKAAIRTLPHADTPTVAYFDTLGRPFLTVANNGKDENDKEILYKTRVILDIEGNQREVIDAQFRIVMKYDYDMLGSRIHQASMEAGERWMLNDVSGKPIRAWDSRGFIRRITYDALRRPVELSVTDASGKEFLAEKTEYGESMTAPETTNHRTKPWKVYDGAGIMVSNSYDFKGNPVTSSRQLLTDYKDRIDWAQNPQLGNETFTSLILYDALNRPIQIVATHGTGAKLNVIQPVYNEANLLEREDVWLEQTAEPSGLLDPGTATQQPVQNIDPVKYIGPVKNINYNAKGQRVLIEYGNGVVTNYGYDPLTFRLEHLKTLRGAERLQDIFYTYDPAGNITAIRDDTQQTIFFNGQVVRPDAEYRYDAIYRLIEANGREHVGQASQPQTTSDDGFRVGLEHPHDGEKMRNYFEFYEYDEVGNFLHFKHYANGNAWTRDYEYNKPSLIKEDKLLDKKNNCLTSTSIGTSNESYTYDAHGNMTFMPHLPEMAWDFKDQLQMVDKGGGCKAYYVYDAAGQRVRKVIEDNDKPIEERIYIGGFEVYHKYTGEDKLERETLHIMDDKQRIAIVDTRTEGEDESPRQALRYQLGNHLGSASLELDEEAQIISYEEYYPYGSTSYQAGPNTSEVKRKRYRYTGKERDEETGLYYHGARYYAPWLGRWVSCDPAGMVDNINLYIYAKSNPIVYVDSNGNQSKMMQAAAAPFKELESWVSNTWTEFKEIVADTVHDIKRDLGFVPPPDLSPKPLTKPAPAKAEVLKNYERHPQTEEEAYKAMENPAKIRVFGSEIKDWESRELQESRRTIKRLNAAIEGFDITGAMLIKGTTELVKLELGSKIIGASLRFAEEGIAGAAEASAKAPKALAASPAASAAVAKNFPTSSLPVRAKGDPTHALLEIEGVTGNVLSKSGSQGASRYLLEMEGMEANTVKAVLAKRGYMSGNIVDVEVQAAVQMRLLGEKEATLSINHTSVCGRCKSNVAQVLQEGQKLTVTDASGKILKVFEGKGKWR